MRHFSTAPLSVSCRSIRESSLVGEKSKKRKYPTPNQKIHNIQKFCMLVARRRQPSAAVLWMYTKQKNANKNPQSWRSFKSIVDTTNWTTATEYFWSEMPIILTILNVFVIRVYIRVVWDSHIQSNEYTVQKLFFLDYISLVCIIQTRWLYCYLVKIYLIKLQNHSGNSTITYFCHFI